MELSSKVRISVNFSVKVRAINGRYIFVGLVNKLDRRNKGFTLCEIKNRVIYVVAPRAAKGQMCLDIVFSFDSIV